jgi:RNA polymerase sigma factor (sigma-70 family)
MQAMDDMALLREYAARNSEAAFETLVSRRVAFVYSAALRQVRDPHLAGEITQVVFILLAQKAGRISEKTILIGWLFKTTRFVALAQMRADAKRRQREEEVFMQSEIQQAVPDPLWERMSPLLDEALATLGKTDRQAVLLRFFENKTLAEIGNSLGTGEDTARKRVSRALEKLHRYFSKHGVSSTTAIIAGAISANSLQAAPAMLAKTITGVATAKGAAAGGSTLTLIKGALKIMAWTKAKTAIVVGAAVILTAGTTAVIVKKIGADRTPAMTKSPFSNVSMQISPFTGVRFDGDTVTVTYDGAEYQLAAINDLSTSVMLDFCRLQYKNSWQKRFTEDLVVVLADMGHPISAEHTVRLTLIGPRSGEMRTVERATMTEKNRQAIHETLSHDENGRTLN